MDTDWNPPLPLPTLTEDQEAVLRALQQEGEQVQAAGQEGEAGGAG